MKLINIRSAVILSSLTLAACSQDSKDSSGSPELLTIEVGVESGAANLTAIPADQIAFTMHLEGCVSGYTASGVGKSITAVVNDRNCVVRLDSITVGGQTFTSTSDTSVFRVGTTNNMLKVTGSGALPSPIVGAHSVSFSFVELSQGQDADAIISTASQTVVVSGEEAPNVEIAAVRHVSFADSGAPEFTFDLKCTADITLPNPVSISNIRCGNQKAGDISLALIKAGSSAPTLQELGSITTWVSITSAVASISINPSNPSSSTIKTKKFAGPGKIFGADTDDNRHMLLVVRGAGASYQYFEVEIPQ